MKTAGKDMKTSGQCSEKIRRETLTSIGQSGTAGMTPSLAYSLAYI